MKQHLMRERLDTLTRREREVLTDLMQGASIRDIARSSAVAESTVRTQVKSIFAKLRVNSQIAAVGLAHRAGWRHTEPVEMTWEWGTRLPDGREIPVSSEDEARAILSGTPIRRKVGPWEGADS